MKNRPWLPAIATACLACACINVAEERIDAENTVGTHSTQDAEIRVVDGHASVRSFSVEGATLWANAPHFDIEIDDVNSTFELEIRNVRAESELVARDGLESIEELESTVVTHKRWQLLAADDTREIRVRLTSPEPPEGTPWKFAVFADVQRAIDSIQDIYDAMNEESLEFCLISGDLTPNGTREEIIRFQRELESLKIPCFATIGNHELGAPEVFFYTLWGRGNTSFDYAGTRFTLIDSATATIAPPVAARLARWLGEAEEQPHAVVMHIPPLDPSGFRNGGFASRAEANSLVKQMAEHNVDIAFYGHVHTYKAFGHAGIPAYVTGGGGAIPQRFDGIGRHYLSVEFDPQTGRFNTAVVRVFPE